MLPLKNHKKHPWLTGCHMFTSGDFTRATSRPGEGPGNDAAGTEGLNLQDGPRADGYIYGVMGTPIYPYKFHYKMGNWGYFILKSVGSYGPL